jgi:hypothetical protein
MAFENAAAGLRHSRAPVIQLLTCESFRELLYFAVGETFANKSMKPIQGYPVIKPEDLFWRPSKL